MLLLRGFHQRSRLVWPGDIACASTWPKVVDTTSKIMGYIERKQGRGGQPVGHTLRQTELMCLGYILHGCCYVSCAGCTLRACTVFSGLRFDRPLIGLLRNRCMTIIDAHTVAAVMQTLQEMARQKTALALFIFRIFGRKNKKDGKTSSNTRRKRS